MNKKIYIAGHKGLVGSAVIRNLEKTGHTNIVTRPHQELDLTNQAAVDDFFRSERPEYVVLSAAKVGGIAANSNAGSQADFIRDNLLIQTNTIEAARKYGCKRFCFLGSSCIYPRDCPQPIKEEYLLSNSLEKTNEMYAIAKIAGLQTIAAYRKQYGLNGYYSLMPTNIYGPNDNFDLETSHMFPALLRKFHEAKINKSKFVEVWGSGNVHRDLLYVDDLANIIVSTLLFSQEMQGHDIPEIMNVGGGQDLYISELASLIGKIIGFDGEIRYDRSRPDGTPRKLLDISKMSALGLKAETSLEDGIRLTYDWYLKNRA